MNNLLLLPSAKIVPNELKVEFGEITSAMIPLGSHPAIYYITEPYSKIGFKTAVAVNEGKEQLEQYVDSNQSIDLRLVDVGNTSNLAETVLGVLTTYTEEIDQLVINFADTLVQGEIVDGNVIFFQTQEDLFRWTTFVLDHESQIVQIDEKNTSKPKESLVFVGVFAISETNLFKNILVEGLSKPRSVDPFYFALMKYFNLCAQDKKKFIKVDKWWDFGHLDTYYATKMGFFLNVRHFNSVQVDINRGILRKTSRNVGKFIGEIEWYLKLPSKLKYIAPRIFDYDLSYESPFVELEFYGYPALSDMFLHGDLDLDYWDRVFKTIIKMLSDMQAYKFVPDDPRILRRCLEEMYIIKTFDRLVEVKASGKFDAFFRNKIVINGNEYIGLADFQSMIEAIVHKAGILESRSFSISHGDLCLSNILFDRRTGAGRLIDPRGEFGSLDIYGDERYDLAKLSHSIEGEYDFIVNNMFDFKWCDGTFMYNCKTSARHESVQKLFREVFINEWGYEMRGQVKLVESLLFLSMVPLHEDRFESQQVFLAKGIELLNKYVE